MDKSARSCICAFSFSDDPENDLLCVGVKVPLMDAEIINAIQGPDVRDIYNKLMGGDPDDSCDGR